MLVLAVFKRRALGEARDRYFIPYFIAAGVFILFALLSAVFSKYPSLAFWGSHDRAEGFVTLFCYIILLLFTIAAYRSDSDYEHILIALSIIVAVSSILGIFQYTGHDLLNTDFGKSLILSPWDSSSEIGAVSISSPGTLYGTFFHYDYVGSFAAIVAPMFLILTLAEKKRRKKIIYGITALLSLWLLFGSTSRAGIVGFVISLLFAVIFFARIIRQKWKISLPCIAVLLVALTVLGITGKGKIFSRIPSLVQDASTLFQSTNHSDYLSKLPVKSVAATGNTIKIVTQQGHTLNATINTKTLLLQDENGQTIKVQTTNGASAIVDPRFNRLGFSFVSMGSDSSLGIAVTIDGQQQFYFHPDSNMKWTMTNATGSYDIGSLETPAVFGFEGKEKLGSARGYIWSRALPMVPQNLLLGAGPDTFIVEFPQNDLLGKYWAYGTTNMIVDKPHNLYLQIFLSDGGIAFLAFLAITVLYLLDSIHLYALKHTYQVSQIFGAAVCLGIIGYLFAGFFNDSIICVAPVFWILLGVGVAINSRNRKTKQKTSTSKAI